MRDQVLADDPICRCPGCPKCTPTGCGRPSTDDDHIVSRGQGGSDERWNHRGMCHPCHHLKSEGERLAGIQAGLSANHPSERHPGLL